MASIASYVAATSATRLFTESTTNATGVETTGETTGQNDTTVILALTAEVATPAKGEIAAKRVFLVDVSAGGTVGAAIGGLYAESLFSNGTVASTAGSGTVVANKDLTIANIKSAANLARFAAYDITLDAVRGGRSSQTVSLVQYASGGSTATVLGQRYTTGAAAAAAVSATNYGFGVDDVLTLTVGGASVSVSPGTGQTTALGDLADDIAAAWLAKYGASGICFR